MPHSNEAVLRQLGAGLQDWLRTTAREPPPQSLIDLLDRLDESEEIRLINLRKTGLRLGRTRGVQRRTPSRKT